MFTLPKLKRFKEVNRCHPGNITAEQWDQNIDKMILWMELYLQDKINYTDDENQSMTEGKELFNEYFYDLWW